MTEEPLNVQVARALGCDPKDRPEWDNWECWCRLGTHSSEDGWLIDYPTVGWAEILERERYGVYFSGEEKDATQPQGVRAYWRAVQYMEFSWGDVDEGKWEEAETPGAAVCKLFVAMKGAKK